MKTDTTAQILHALDTLCRAEEHTPHWHISAQNPISTGPLTTEIARQSGISTDKTRKTLQKLEKNGIIQSKPVAGGSTRWWLPPQHKPI